MIIPIVPDKSNLRKTAKEVGDFLYKAGMHNYVDYNAVVTTITVNSVVYEFIMDYTNNQVILIPI